MAPLPTLPGPPAARERHHHHHHHHRRRAHGLYFHSSPPKVLQMNNHLAAKENDYRSRDAIKPSSIRIWLHHKQMGKLAKVLWAGQGMRLRTETSHHPRMKRFLECVPHVMGVIKDIHQAVIDNDLDVLKEKTAPPAPRVILTSKDANGLTPLHKAAGLAHTQIVEYILSVWPSLSSDEDHTGKTPLHWAASAKNNARSFNLLVQAGADETALDDRNKPAEHYKNKPGDIDRSLLAVIPEAPRISQQGFPAYFDWAMFTLPDDSDEGSQPTRMKPFLSQNNLLDPDGGQEGGLAGGAADTVSKSKSVHNLTNGVLTVLGQERDVNGEGSSLTKGSADEEQVDAQDDANGGQDVDEKELGGEETSDKQDGTLVEHEEQISTPPAGPDDTDAPLDVSSAKVDDSGGDDSVDDAQEIQQTEPEADRAEGISETKNETGAPVSDAPNAVAEENNTENGHTENGVTVEEEDQTNYNDTVASRNTSAKEVNTDELDNTAEVELEKETNSASAALEEAEVSRDSLEQVVPKDDDIELDSLGKDLEPEEPLPDAARVTSAESDKNSEQMDSQPNSRATTGRSIKSTITVTDQDDIKENVSRNSSATAVSNGRPDTASNGNMNGTVKPNGTPEDVGDQDGLTSAGSERPETRGISAHRTYPNSAKEPTSPVSRPISRAEVETISRAASSTLTPGHTAAKSSRSSTPYRKASIGSRKSVSSAVGSAAQNETHDGANNNDDDDDDNSEANDDSNNADVKIASYRTPDENTTSEQLLEKTAETHPDQPELEDPPQAVDETSSAKEEPMARTEIETVTQSATSTQLATAAATEASSQVLEIEGTVEGEPDQGQLQSQNDPPVEHDDQPNMQQTVQDAIDSADLEQLAAIVLNGEGKQLIGRKSDQTEIQAFLDNVPAYMGKIRRVHLAAREGSLRDLQSALDRRKFATAKDEVSPHGATPLHVATIFGHAGIVRYLAGRFPETLSATDDDGRTPLHYAATLKDNGHFYNLLTHLGANPKVEDSLNHSAEYYLGHVQSQGILSHRQLLRDYGAKEELADEMLNDQVPDDLHSARRPLDDVDTLTTLERCFKIIHEPIDDLVVKSVGLPTNSVPGSASSLRILITSYLARFLKRSVFDKVKKRQTRLDHNLFDLIWPAMKKATKEKRLDEDLNVGIVIPDYDVFVVFQEFLVPLIKDVHCMEGTQPLMPHPAMQFFPRYAINDQQPDAAASPTASNNGNILRENPDSVQLNLDTSGKYITGCVIECARNLDAYEFPLNLGIAQLEQVERLITARVLSMDFVHATGETELGTYYSMNEILENPSEIRTILATNGLLIPLLDHTDPYQTAESIAINGRYWPYGRGVYVSVDGSLVVWVNAQDHLRLLCCTGSKDPAAIGAAYSKVGRAMNFLEEWIMFKHSYFLGCLLSRPSFLGTGLKFTLTLVLPHLCKEKENLRHLCVVRGLQLFTGDGDGPTVRMCNMRSLAQTEWQLFQDFSSAITNVVALEKELSMSNSLHIAATLLRIFRKKKHSLAADGAVSQN
ncbi:uncharacterized protein LOC121597143 isoform X1 [Anopheles merus]|uniref:uncharacterized protein LOC121597143 isoform X1 n=2 Tax=Anopheles merus TaxID=30066 RepID=UPI001BE44A09|nr:uncharacterized protein LOC121597143 isoform X1 [Anopheles merus]